MSKCVFLDRDGTIIEDKEYVHKKEDLKFLPGSISGLKKLQKLGYKLIVITNQAGIARGLYTTKDAEKFNNELMSRLAVKGVKIEKILFCPHHPDFTGPCLCRKPDIGMVKAAATEFNIKPGQCFFIGDKDCDIQLGKNCGEKTFLIDNGQYKTTVEPDYKVKNLLEAAEIIKTLKLI